MKTQYVLIIDVALSGNSLAYEFVKRGYRIINIYSSKKVFQKLYKSLNNSLYETCLIYESDEQLLEDLTQYKNDIICCCPGSDHGLPLSNYLTELFKFGINNKLISDRFEVLKAAGEIVSDNNFNDFLNQYKKCVIKPKISYGGYDRVQVVESLDNIDTTDMFIMPFINGDEYVVDTVTLNGKHKLVAVWKYSKENGFWREKITLLDYTNNEDLIEKLYNYTCNILDKVNYALGATHTEIILENGIPKLIEINFRTHGHLDYETSFKILTQPQIQLTVDAMLGDEIAFSDLRPTYCKKINMERINLFNNRERRFSQFPWQQISKLPSYGMLFCHYLKFEYIPISQHIVESIPGEVILLNTDQEQLHKDELEIYRLCNE
jgi:hypothetical protein